MKPKLIHEASGDRSPRHLHKRVDSESGMALIVLDDEEVTASEPLDV